MKVIIGLNINHNEYSGGSERKIACCVIASDSVAIFFIRDMDKQIAALSLAMTDSLKFFRRVRSVRRG